MCAERATAGLEVVRRIVLREGLLADDDRWFDDDSARALEIGRQPLGIGLRAGLARRRRCGHSRGRAGAPRACARPGRRSATAKAAAGASARLPARARSRDRGTSRRRTARAPALPVRGSARHQPFRRSQNRAAGARPFEARNRDRAMSRSPGRRHEHAEAAERAAGRRAVEQHGISPWIARVQREHALRRLGDGREFAHHGGRRRMPGAAVASAQRAEDQRAVGAAEAEGIADDRVDLHRAAPCAARSRGRSPRPGCRG